MLVAGIIHHSRGKLKAWSRVHSIESHESFIEARSRVEEGTIGLSARGRRLVDGLEDFVDRNLHQGAWLRGVASRARRLIAGLFRALTDDPRLAEDYLLLRFKEDCGGPYLRDIPLDDMEKEIARRYRGSARFKRIVVDHIAGMTDMYAVSEYERLLGAFRAGPGAL
jgi:dGTP triphosphohydrolase